MFSIAQRNLFQEKLRLALSSGGVALAIMLILILQGFFDGMNRQISAYLDNTPADVVVGQKDLRNFLGASSRLKLSLEHRIERVEGVKKVVPVFANYVVLDLGGRREFALLVGLDPEKGGGPWQMVEGRARVEGDEVVMDQLVARRHGLGIRDKVEVLGRDLTIVGLSGGTSSWMTGTMFIPFDTAAELLAGKGRTSFFLVSAERGVSAGGLARRIRREVKDISATPKTIVAANDVELFAGVFSKPIQFMVTTGFLIGVMLVGLTIYTATVERAREYGVLKAIGMRNSRLYAVVLEQALISAALGLLFGVPLAFGVREFIHRAAPQFLVLIEWSYVGRAVLVALAMSFLASYMPVRAIARIDPAIAFRRGA